MDCIQGPDLRVFRGNEQPAAREQCDDRGLAHVGRLAAHVRPGDDQQPSCGVELEIVGDEMLDLRLDHGMPAAANGKPRCRDKSRAHPVQHLGLRGVRGKHVESRQRERRTLQPGDRRCELGEERVVERLLAG